MGKPFVITLSGNWGVTDLDYDQEKDVTTMVIYDEDGE